MWLRLARSKHALYIRGGVERCDGAERGIYLIESENSSKRVKFLSPRAREAGAKNVAHGGARHARFWRDVRAVGRQGRSSQPPKGGERSIPKAAAS